MKTKSFFPSLQGPFARRAGFSVLIAFLIGSSAVRAANITIRVVGDSFVPASTNINVGDTVSWTGLGGAHNVTGSNAGDRSEFCGDGGFGTETSCSHTFTTSGSFPYECTIHASCCNMVGTINVNAAQPPPTPTVNITVPTDGETFAFPATVDISADASVSSGSVTNVSFFAGTNFLGSAAAAPFSIAASLDPGSYALTAVATAAGVSATSTVVNITVSQPAPPPTPTVSITNPVDGATFSSPASIQISADASVSSGSVTNVSFFAGTNFLGSATAAPFSIAASLNPGSYALTAVATAAGVSATSTVVNITVSQPAPPPAVTLSSPIDGSIFAAPASFQLAADASVSSGSVTNVTFYSDATAVGSAAAPPFTAFVNNLGAGAYHFTAVAIAGGLATTSTVVNVTVVAPSPTDTAISAPVVANARFTFSFAATPGLVYAVQSSPDLAQWTTVTNITATVAATPFSDAFQPGAAALYYRVVRQPNP